MLKVKTKIGPSGIHGTGLFADEFIPKGTITWEWNPDFDIAFEENALNSLSKLMKDYILYYAYFDKDIKKLVLCADNQRYINHSKSTNIDSTPKKDTASRDIQIGEELLCNYNLFDDTYFKRMGINETTLNGQ